MQKLSSFLIKFLMIFAEFDVDWIDIVVKFIALALQVKLSTISFYKYI